MILNSKRVVIKNFIRKDLDHEYISWLNNKDLLKYVERISPLNDAECCICYSDYTENESISKLPCKQA